MASFTALTVVSTGTGGSNLKLYPTWSFFSSRSAGDGFFHEKMLSSICVPLRSERKLRSSSSCLTVKAMGGVAKFKGTQMKEKQLTEMIEKKVMEAKEACEGDQRSDECKVAWDEVEEVSQAKADLRLKLEKEDPLESFCQDNPETDECRVYED